MWMAEQDVANGWMAGSEADLKSRPYLYWRVGRESRLCCASCIHGVARLRERVIRGRFGEQSFKMGVAGVT